MDQNSPNQPPNSDSAADENRGRRVFSETFVFTGPGQSILSTMHNIMNRFASGPQTQQQPEPQQQGALTTPETNGAAPDGGRVPSVPTAPDAGFLDSHTPSTGGTAQDQPSIHRTTVDATQLHQQQTMPETAATSNNDGDDRMPGIEPIPPALFGDNVQPPSPRPIRPLPRNGVRPTPVPHAHFHAHTPNGTIDLFTFSVSPGEALPPPPPGSQSFTFELGSDAFAGFEAFLLGMPNMEKEREPDVERAKVLLRGMEVVPEGLVRRLEHAGGVPGGHGTEESSASGCAVCWGPLLDEVEVGEWDTALHTIQQEKSSDKEDEKKDDDLRGCIVALPCAHVYHAECLLPWFSRQTTCPTCRFDVDPDSLTWNPRPLPPPPPQAGDVPQPQLDADDPNAAEAARFAHFLSSPFLFRPSRPAPAPAPTPNRRMFGPEPLTQSHPQSQTQPQMQTQTQPQPQLQSQPQPHVPPHFLAHPLLPIRFAVDVSTEPSSPPNNSNDQNPPPSTQNPASPNMNPTVIPSTFSPFAPTTAPWTDAATPNNSSTRNDPPHRGFIPFPMFFVQPGGGPPQQRTQAPAPFRERRKWSPPDPVGKTLRQRVEQKERELGLRCYDPVCCVAPTDEDPVPPMENAAGQMRIAAAYDARGCACEHEFHPGCLVTSARVAGVQVTEGETDVEVQCPVCRAEGTLARAAWLEGVKAVEAEALL